MRSLSQKAPRAAMSVAPGSDSMNNGTVLPPVGFESFFFFFQSKVFQVYFKRAVLLSRVSTKIDLRQAFYVENQFV